MNLKPEPLPVQPVHWAKIAVPVLILAIMVAALGVGLDVSGKSSFCADCHAMRPYVKSLTKGTHKNTDCIDCHQDPGLIGSLTQRTDMVKNYSLVSIYFQRQSPTLTAGVSTAGCLKCHEPIASTTIVSARGIRVSHKEIIAAGLNCGRCHPTVAHFSKAANAQLPAHDYCFACHKKSAGSRACALCHVRDIGDTGPGQIDNYRKIEINLNKCDGCHSMDSCGRCHPEVPQLQVF